MGIFSQVTQLTEQPQSLLVQKRYGRIEVARERFHRIQLRPWPKLISVPEATWWGAWQHRQRTGCYCCLYYNQPWQHSSYLNLAYIESSGDSTVRNTVLALQILDWVAWQKRSEAILCEVTNARISDRILERFGWERHLLTSPRRHWIKRFYGDFATIAATWPAVCAAAASAAEGPRGELTVR